jgi:RNA polymerase sigma-70 factor (ECF subfamily)
MDNLQEISKEEYVELINANRLKMYKTAMAILKNDEDACDAIQEALLSSYKSLSSLKNKEFFVTWITRILINKCYDIIQKNKRVVYVDDNITENTLGYYDTYKTESELEYVLSKLDEELKQIVVLYYYDELKVGEISNILLIPEGTVKSRLARARKKIEEILKKEEGDK